MNSAQTTTIDPIGEIYTEATIQALNAALAQENIEASAVIAVLPVPSRTMATISGPQFRVLFRKA
ncbi:hypothetical protein BA190_32860 [Labrys sp. WJW]|jgi:hypothetical protein|uniref:hypothetical protein n=1 Tax=Labrys sp. WJW TaxID=1737983 RepID=UPI00082B549D|nr:hypothetical protein [Labrys sp. WJW]OCC00654.1 hypothetical protein BA190_32860 [Labrys sp. WJW]